MCLCEQVCELRITRKPVASRKVRRTRLLETGGDDALAGDGSSGGAGAVASAGAGGSGASGAVASPVPPQSAAVQRDADRLQAAEESVKLALEWVTSVLFNAPLAYQLSELEVWLPLMQVKPRSTFSRGALCFANPHACCALLACGFLGLHSCFLHVLRRSCWVAVRQWRARLSRR